MSLQAARERRGALVGPPALRPVLQVDDDHRLVLAASADHREARDREDASDLRDLEEQVDGAERHVSRAVARRALGHLHRGEDDALVLLGEERRLCRAKHLDRQQDREDEERESEEDARREPLRELDEKSLERVDRPVEPRERTVLVGPRLVEYERAERRRERKRAHGREADRGGERDGELLVDASRDTAHEADWDEDAEKDKRRRDDGGRHVAHRLDRRLLRVEAARLDEELHALHDDDAVVYYDADREDESEQREDVDRVAEEGHQDERRGKRHGDREARNQRRAQVLQEQVADEHDESERDEERVHDLVDARAHVVRRVVGDDPLEVVGERLLELRHRLAYRLHSRDGVRSRLLL